MSNLRARSGIVAGRHPTNVSLVLYLHALIFDIFLFFCVGVKGLLCNVAYWSVQALGHVDPALAANSGGRVGGSNFSAARSGSYGGSARSAPSAPSPGYR